LRACLISVRNGKVVAPQELFMYAGN